MKGSGRVGWWGLGLGAAAVLAGESLANLAGDAQVQALGSVVTILGIFAAIGLGFADRRRPAGKAALIFGVGLLLFVLAAMFSGVEASDSSQRLTISATAIGQQSAAR